MHYYGCATKMEEADVKIVDVPLIEFHVRAGDEIPEGRQILERLLRSRGRRLTDEQWGFVMKKVKVIDYYIL